MRIKEHEATVMLELSFNGKMQYVFLSIGIEFDLNVS